MDAFTLDGVKRLEDQGVTDVIVGFRNAYETDNQTLQQKLDALRGYADRVIRSCERAPAGIDVHHHILPPEYLRGDGAAAASTRRRPAAFPSWDAASTLGDAWTARGSRRR